MTYLTKQQLAMLKRCASSTVDCQKISKQEREIIELLEQYNFVDTKREMVPMFINNTPNPFKGSLLSAQISEAGKSFLVEKEIDEKRFRMPYMVSIISLLIATLAMLISAASLCLQLFGNTPTP